MEENSEVATTIDQKLSFKEPKGQVISRRKFLKLGTKAAVGAFIAGLIPRASDPTVEKQISASAQRPTAPPEVIHSSEAELEPPVRVLDFFVLEQARAQLIQTNFPSDINEREAWKEMGVTDPTNIEDVKNAVPAEGNPYHVKLLMMVLFKDRYKDHGRNVIDVMGKAASYYATGQPVVTPVRTSIASAV
jgi:hypothetical protein